MCIRVWSGGDGGCDIGGVCVGGDGDRCVGVCAGAVRRSDHVGCVKSCGDNGSDGGVLG